MTKKIVRWTYRLRGENDETMLFATWQTKKQANVYRKCAAEVHEDVGPLLKVTIEEVRS